MGHEEGYLNLEQVASIIQLNNEGHMGRNIVTTLLYGTKREDWDEVLTNMQEAELATIETTNEQTARIRDKLKKYGKILFQHKKDRISGIYPMHMSGHWRVMIVSHVLKQVFLLDPLGDGPEPYGFTTEEINKVQNSYREYDVSTCPQHLQTDGFNCGVWVAWVASMWTTHVRMGLEGTTDISKVIKAGLTSQGILDINIHPTRQSNNETYIQQVRKQYQRQIYEDPIPQHLKDWLDHWNTPISDVQTFFTRTHLPQICKTSSGNERTNPIHL